MIEIGTSFLFEDEPCFCLTEDDLVIDRKRRRYRSYTVVRGDNLATFREDLGDSRWFKTDPIRIIGGVRDPVTQKLYIEETVGSLLDIALTMRAKPSFNKSELVGIDIA
uniref:Uncharacterized protein n=1 Tax=viral metagenome TaxID=1070528 RepID=A0A6M3LTM4_9ZZZZ